jgi:hypothetical protein
MRNFSIASVDLIFLLCVVSAGTCGLQARFFLLIL